MSQPVDPSQTTAAASGAAGTPGMPFNIVINNAATSSASAAAAASVGGRLPRKRHSIAVHVVLLFLTAGIGNLVYWWWIANENRKRGY
nr:MAG TPA: hypothetical protein [Caudoviricetes sp.]